MPPDPKRRIVVLTLTERCNLSCVYCFEQNKTTRHMDVETAMRAIRREFEESDGFEEIEIDLFGGEPTLRQTEIKHLVEWTCAQNFTKPFLFFLETNGTLIHGEFQDWLAEHRDVVRVGLSLDGTRETHNKNRCNSYDDIDIPFFVKTYPDQPVRMTIHDSSIESLYMDVVHLHALGFSEVTATFARGIDWHERRDVLEHQLFQLCEFYLAHPEIKECSVFDMNLPSVLRPEKRKDKWCGTGTTMVSYAVDGTRYPCHTFQANTTGSSRPLTVDEIDFRSIADFSYEGCRECILESVCPNCYGMNFTESGDILRRDLRACWIVKARALAVSYLMAKRIERDPGWKSGPETYHTIAAIKAVQESMSSR